ncbi:GNAT family N-acetyltransferase [Cupriavidus taiwanensis]|uniref:GNAT family N-acetyltransferase n=1 Tax=Cupriavidus taiwanensis TaxID=164546 RepID=UPI000E1AA9C8|nr:GNAT family N-acetyltransferase [Cupriavidus taiwanensis]SOZ33453.1 N-acetylglutamate synthase [Cupriavidus taiwanensis]SPA38208.1 N-acetylglutamate synthase [Cupriavidus taiwanensis]
MLRDLRIRLATSNDLPAVATVVAACNLQVDDLGGAVDPLLGGDQDAFHVAELNGEIIGCAGVERFDDVAVIRSVAVLPKYRQQGVATHLVSAVLMRARAQGARRAVLATSHAPSYFSRYGFTLISAETLPAAVRASHTLKIAGIPPALCMHCELR